MIQTHRATSSSFRVVSLILACFLGSLFTIFAKGAWAKVEYDSNQLMMKNAEQISELVRKKIKKAQEIQANQETDDDAPFSAEKVAVELLRDAMRIVLSRPDQDGTRSNAFSRVRRELVDLNSLDSAIEDLSQEAISSLQGSKTTAKTAGTYIVMLESLMSEIKPEIKTNTTFKRIIESIRDAGIKVSDETKNQVFLRTMSKPISPSETAAKILPKAK